jgi:hypothetical protein
MKFLSARCFLKFLCALSVLSVCNLAWALDREAFSITNYDLNLQIDPSQHRLGARGKITLRNDTSTPQKVAVLQVSSSLNWRVVKAGAKSLQFVTQPYASDIDHTGGLSEAIVNLPEPVAPHASTDLDIAYEGVIQLDATRLIRIGTPEDIAASTDWDQIGPTFSAVRGAGYVAWYPIATDVANLSEGDSLFEVLARWNTREKGAKAHLKISITQQTDDTDVPELILNHPKCDVSAEQMSRAQFLSADCEYERIGPSAPAMIIGNYDVLQRPHINVHFLTGHDASAATYADTTEKVEPLISDWFGAEHEKAETADLPHSDDAPFESGALLLAPLANSAQPGLSAAHQLTHASFFSFRPWIEEGLAHFAQALYLEEQKGRQSALDYMGLHRTALMKIEPSDAAAGADQASHSLVNTINEELYRSKAMCVWWMLRDMIGDAALKKAIASYRPEEDKEASYMPRLIAAQTQRDLEWFFDEWVYRDRGLPDFKVESAFSRKALNNTFILTVTVENLGTAGAEVPIIVKFAGGQITKRLEVRARDKATIRIETPAAATEVTINDGSVPESDVTNNNVKVEPPKE